MQLNNETNFENGSISSSDFYCQPVRRIEYIYFLISSVTQILLNTVIITSVIRSRGKLRHNFVYAYVASTLAANISFGLCTILIVSYNEMASANPYRIEYDKPEDRALMRWWTFGRSLTASVFLIMNANVGALIFGLRDSSYFIGRFVATPTTDTTRRTSIKSRKNRAIFLIVNAWLIPLLLSLIPPLTEVCSSHCLCSPGNYLEAVCQTEIYSHCSRIWIPVSNYFLAVIVGTWLVEAICIVGLLLNTITKFFRAVYPDSTASPLDTSAEGSSSASQPPGISRWRKLPPFNNSIKLLIAITSSYVIFTIPTMVVLTMDIFMPHGILSYIIVALCILPITVYAFISPIIMVKYMPGLRSALVDLLSLLDCSRSSERRRANAINATLTPSRSDVLPITSITV